MTTLKQEIYLIAAKVHYELAQAENPNGQVANPSYADSSIDLKTPTGPYLVTLRNSKGVLGVYVVPDDDLTEVVVVWPDG